ncbi:MAG: response regulator [Ignavibacteriales bacterium]|nr:response regulator [Ignavibacteriales bacterium]
MASTAVIVAMVTIITVRIAAGVELSTLDFINVVTVGIFGYVSIFFALKYGRNLETQRREMIELNSIAEAVNYSVDINYVLQSALIKVLQLMHADAGWIYIIENNSVVLKHHYGSTASLFKGELNPDDESLNWIRTPGLHRTTSDLVSKLISRAIGDEGIRILTSIPLLRQGVFAGALIIGLKDTRRAESKKVALLQAFGNQISMALNNASLFEQVKQSEQLYADLYENSPDMYHSVDRSGIVISCNQTESLLLDKKKEEIIGKSLTALYPSSQHANVTATLKKIFDDGRELKGVEAQIISGSGKLIDVSMNTSLVYDGRGKPIVARMLLRDITEKKKMEEQILQAQKIDSIGNLAGGIAHDFNNILTAILGSASIMRRRVQDNPRLLKYVDLIETTSRRGAAVTRQLLTFARKSNPHAVRTDVNAILDQTLKLFEVTTPKTIHIKLNLTSEPLFVEADEGQLQQAILNLCLNARDAMPNGGIIVVNCSAIEVNEEQARLITEGRTGSYVMISVADSGTGIPASILHKIYEPFFTTKEQGKGTGLGLSVVYGVVKSHNGFINVKSEIDSGTIFTIYLPRISNDLILNQTQYDKSNIKGGSERILLAEDEISIGEIGVDILQELGYKIDSVSNGREAYEKIKSENGAYELIILDMNMPRQGGKETFDQLKKEYPLLKVLVCSGYSATMLEDGRFIESLDGFLQKPYTMDDLAFKVREVLDNPPKKGVTLNEIGR